MTTAEIAQELEAVLTHFPMLAGWNANTLLGVIERELGHPEILDGFRPYGNKFAQAIPIRSILHVVSGNIPHAALQSLVRGLLLGCQNFVKIPATGLPAMDEFVRLLPPSLAPRVQVSRSLDNSWLANAEAVVVFGTDETISALRNKISSECIFLAHGHRISLGIVFEDPDYESVPSAALDVFLYDQRGCLSPHTLYVAPSINSLDYAARLANELENLCRTNCEPHSPSEAAAIFSTRHYFHFLQSFRPGVKIWTSKESTNWTVVHDSDPTFRSSPLGRTIFVKPLPKKPADFLAPIHQWISGIGIWPSSEKYARIALQLGASRICPLGKLQFPPPDWHQDGLPSLSQLVRWVDFEDKS